MPRVTKPTLGRGSQAHLWRQALGCFISDRRKEVGLTQEELAALMGLGSLGRVVSSIERGRTTLSPDRYRALASALKVTDRTLGRIVLRCQDPCCYGLIYGFDEQLEAELDRAKRCDPPVRPSAKPDEHDDAYQANSGVKQDELQDCM